MPRLQDKVAIVTGASRGIGAAIAARLAGEGVQKLLLADRDEDRLRDFAFSLPCERQMMIGDVADEGMWEQADLTGVTHAVVNAGVAAGGTIEELAFDEWRRVMAVNLDGAFLTLRAAMRAISRHVKYTGTTDSSGSANLTGVDPDEYYIFGITKVGRGFAMWDAPVNIIAGENVLNLSPSSVTEIPDSTG